MAFQECRRAWAKSGENYSYSELTQMASRAEPFKSIVDPDAPDFLHPEDMPSAVRAYCQRTGQAVPETKPAILRCIFESLAVKYRYVYKRLEKLIGYTFDVVHIIGGGSQNEFLNQLTADALNIPVTAGPVEATALGNAMMQAVTLKYYKNIFEARQALSAQMELKEFHPISSDGWEEIYHRFLKLVD